MVRAMSALKRQPGKNIVVHDGVRTAQVLARQQPVTSDTNPLNRTHRQGFMNGQFGEDLVAPRRTLTPRP